MKEAEKIVGDRPEERKTHISMYHLIQGPTEGKGGELRGGELRTNGGGGRSLILLRRGRTDSSSRRAEMKNGPKGTAAAEQKCS